MHCREFVKAAGPWTEGEHAAEAEAHLRSCGDCRALIADLEAIRDAAQTPEEARPEPPARVWRALRARLEEEGIIHEQAPRSWLAGLLEYVPRPALAGAYLAIIVLGAAFLMTQHSQVDSRARWMDSMTATMAPMDSQLVTAAEASLKEVSVPNSAVTEELHRNMAIVDKYIALCEKSVREEPDNEMARDYLYDAYQQKADLVAQIADHGSNGR